MFKPLTITIYNNINNIIAFNLLLTLFYSLLKFYLFYVLKSMLLFIYSEKTTVQNVCEEKQFINASKSNDLNIT